jgi:arylsulfatase A-like enzyme
MHHIRTLYEEVLRVPLLFKLPGGRGRSIRPRVAERISNLDIAPTILDLAGIEPPSDFEGRSLRPLMSQVGRDRPIFAHTLRHESDRATLIQGDLKVIHSMVPGEEGTELYDLGVDDKESTDLAETNPAMTRQALDRLLSEIERMRIWGKDRNLELDPTSLTAEQIEHLRALGYVD